MSGRLPEPVAAEPLGLERGVVRLVAYDPRWPALFERESDALRAALGPKALAVHHVGSTAVPGLCAKPILDVLVTIGDFAEGPALAGALEPLGYEFRPAEDIPDRHYFRKRRGTAGTHHLSLAVPSSWHHRATLAFRDALRADLRRAEAYAALKLELAERYAADRPAYIEGKAAFVAGVLVSVGLTRGA